MKTIRIHEWRCRFYPCADWRKDWRLPAAECYVQCNSPGMAEQLAREIFPECSGFYVEIIPYRTIIMRQS